MKFYNDKGKYSGTDVSWRLEDAEGKPVKQTTPYGSEKLDYLTYACFSPITYEAIPKEATKIVVFEDFHRIPYSKEIIVKWIEELTKLGFPASFEDKGNTVEFTIKLSDYKYKMHVSCALQLIRCLIESGIFMVPEFYFSSVKDDDSIDARFIKLQEAHFQTVKKNMYANTNHMVTFPSNSKTPIARKKLFKNIEETKFDVYNDHYTNLSLLWAAP